MDRPTRVIKTPIDGVDVKIKTYITGRESEQIDDIMYRQLKLSAGTTKESALANMEATFLTEQTHKLIELMVTDKTLDEILDMKKEDYLFVLKELGKSTGGGSLEERKKKA